ncbi:Adenine/guanine permease AZG1 [Tetrabaena socialis]|uniref:Adenine/guanine permease AZG1 n=1 Tax=Tetrabaena socialis TaxID=47790 RepID=A0A2J8AAY7_9CHLO|nr:Adenine/guanine permease AZG1 [Tetrabaena socialis]|eukprot:PNH09686.1 Adenine/guanine permease AZG1 [Tetrabaena socialis]
MVCKLCCRAPPGVVVRRAFNFRALPSRLSLAVFFAPIISSIPPYATGHALILVGALMIENLLDIDWKDYQQAIPAFITISVIPLTYSIAYGIIGGVMSYMLLWFLLLIYDIITCRLYGKSIREVLIAAPDVLKPYEVMEAEEIGRQFDRIEQLRKEMEDAQDMLAASRQIAEDRHASKGGDNSVAAAKTVDDDAKTAANPV